MSDQMAQIRASFFLECEELLEALQDGLTTMENAEHDGETINVIFRAVHSIKGGAGAFGLDCLVEFAHHYETTLDAVRSGKVTPDAAALKLFFRAGDVLADLVRCALEETAEDRSAIDVCVGDLGAFLSAAGVAPEEPDEDNIDFQPMEFSLDLPAGATPDTGGVPVFDLTFKPDSELFSSGNEPLHILKALRDLGEFQVTCLTDDLPPLDRLDAETAYLGWQIRLTTHFDQSEIRDVFDFVEDVCELTITAVDGQESALPLPPILSPEGPNPVAELANLAGPAPQRVNLPGKATPPGPGATAPRLPDDSSAPPHPVPLPDPAKNPPAKSTPPKAQATVRVDIERVDRLVNLVGELVINQAMLSQSVTEAGLASDQSVSTGLDEFMQLTRDIQDSVMMIRAQPVKSLFQRMGRIVREASGDLGKDVQLLTVGEATEIDKTVIERLADPLTHMVRNAVDHGLESTQDRLAAGKPGVGMVSLSAAHRSGRVVIEVSDDGGGINRERVLQTAISKGLVAASAQLTESEIDNLLFLPGFSTVTEVSNLSGRGVGMDVVRNAIVSLGGRISITSKPGLGTTFSISLPLTLAVQDGMVVRVAGQTLVVPLNHIVETLMLSQNEIRALGPTTSVLQVRDRFLPLLDLASELGYCPPRGNYEGSIALIIAQDDEGNAAHVVDEILEKREVVIKGLQ
ncbi:MAG: chemotaxis protein CheA, partial [Halocynthiibacter sp.]